MSDVGVAVIGAGVIGAGVIGAMRATTIRRNPDATLVGVADVDLDRARQLAGSSARAVAAYRALIDDPTVSALVVASPVHHHEDMVTAAGTGIAVERNVFRLDVSESRYEAVAEFVRDELPPNALLFAYQQSGSLRHYAERMTVRFDMLAPAWLERAVADLASRGYHPFFVIEDHELDLFRQRFESATPLGRLDWPARAEYAGEVAVGIYDPADRANWINGEDIATQSIGP